MTRTSPHSHDPGPRRARITLAVITAVLAGAVRAVISWLLDHLITGG
ncbi:hypothetical protein [Actinoplanes sichuanensis]|uniref:Uncharacterized protein n=1 Tax=Actinoplanes sichuanensis TaxID=512349 RepID=A0ABW4A2P5_9ACTN|nr:hypothetical protein [Actinoplanes sichuanensis]